MKITKAKLIKGQYLEVSFSDGTAEVHKSYPHTEAPPKLLKVFQRLNSHLCDLTEQYDSTGEPDYDNIAARGYSIKGDSDKEGVTITGLRTLSEGSTITLNSPFSSLDIVSGIYHRTKALVECLESCRAEITSFMENNKSQEEIQGKLFTASSEDFVVMSEDTANKRSEDGPFDVAPEVLKVIEEKLSPEQIQNQMDEEMPLNQEMIQENNARKNRKKKATK